MGKRQKQWVIQWDSEALISSSIRIEGIDNFDARGKRRVYSRGDHFVRSSFHMDVWQSRDRRLLVRFWSSNQEADGYSYEIVGLLDSKISDDKPNGYFSEHWIPECLRQEYDTWVISWI